MSPGLFAPAARVTAYAYASAAGLLTGDGDLEFLRCLGLRAWHLAQYYGVQPWSKIWEGPYLVWLWPERVWDIAAWQMAQDAARFGMDYARCEDAARQPWRDYEGGPYG